MTRTLAWLLGLDQTASVDEVDVSLAAAWAADGSFWLFAGCASLIAVGLLFYLRGQSGPSRRARILLGLSRGLLLALLLLTLADPVLRVSLSSVQPPLVYLVFDATESMAIRDAYTEQEVRRLERAFQLPASADATSRSRMDWVQAMVRDPRQNLVRALIEQHGCRVRAFAFDGNSTSRLRELEFPLDDGGVPAPEPLAEQLTTRGQVTAFGEMLEDAGRQFGDGRLSAVVVFSDFAHNAGIAPVGGHGQQQRSPAARLGVPLYTVGVGATEAADLAVDLQLDPKMKRAERSSVRVKLRQQGLLGRQAIVSVAARRLGGADAGEPNEVSVGSRAIALTLPTQTLEFPFTPEQSGRFEFIADVQPAEDEIVTDNNRTVREVQVIDDFLRLMYVANEPTWEWRFVKEVFHRDPLVGMDGFRTYLASSDPQVREANPLFLPTLTPRRSEFFANDVIFLGDLPGTALNERFCEMVEEFVGRFGGGLVVLAGPRFGPQQLAGTAIEDLLPVILDAQSTLRDETPFRPRRTLHADRYPFMQLGDSPAENVRAWENLRLLPWYQPVIALRDASFALAEHPRDRCRDGRTPQPLIAVRAYGAGEVVYLGFNEMWRLRRLYGERYYRQFWSQLIYRLGMSHVLGSGKRFVVRTDRSSYRADEVVVLTVEAYDRDFEPVGGEPQGTATLAAEIVRTDTEGRETTRELRVPLLRPGVFEAQVPVFAGGSYRIRVRDPIDEGFQDVLFDVSDVSAERRTAVRNRQLQQQLADESGGAAYELTDVQRLAEDLAIRPVTEHYTRNVAIWSTRLWFGLLVALMLGEWLIRKLVRLV